MPLDQFTESERSDFLDAVGQYSCMGVSFEADRTRDGMVRVTRFPDGVSRTYKPKTFVRDLADDLRNDKLPWGRG